MKKEIAEQIQEEIRLFLEKMSFGSSEGVAIEAEEDGAVLSYNIHLSKDSKYMIGQHGDNLKAMQHILRLAMRRRFPDEKVDFIVDINKYRKEKNGSIIDVARKAAKEASMDKKAVILREMSAYERRLVHMELKENPDVVTESIGEGDQRKVVVRPVGMIE